MKMKMKEFAIRADEIKAQLDKAVIWRDMDTAQKKIERLHEAAEALNALADEVYADTYSDILLSRLQREIKEQKRLRWVKQPGGKIYPSVTDEG